MSFLVGFTVKSEGLGGLGLFAGRAIYVSTINSDGSSPSWTIDWEKQAKRFDNEGDAAKVAERLSSRFGNSAEGGGCAVVPLELLEGLAQEG
jgi:hypothetical protein